MVGAGVLVLAGILVLPVQSAEDNKAEAPEGSSPPTLKALEEQLYLQQQRLQALEQLVKDQSTLLERLTRQLQKRQPGVTPGEEDADPMTVATAPAGRVSPDTAESGAVRSEPVPAQPGPVVTVSAQKSEETPKPLKDLKFSGDIRIRYEPFFGGTGPDRHRGRVRARFNVATKFGEEWQGTLRLATGGLSDPTTGNQSFTGFLTRKPISVDRAFLTYTPKWAKPLSLTGGKFPFTWKTTQLTFDSDINPEGLSETLSFDVAAPALKNVTLVGYQVPFRESSGGPDSYLLGGQVQTSWQISDRVKFSGFAGYSNWQRTDAIRAAQTSGTVTGNNIFNAASATAFASRFGLFDFIGQVDIDTGNDKWPVRLLVDYVTNARACAQAVTIGVACSASDRQGHWAEVVFGRGNKPNDVKLGYTFIRLEREAVLGQFTFSDIRASTNNVNHRFSFGYQLNPSLLLNYNLYVGRQLLTASSPLQEPWLKRMQFDAVYKF
jgi:hypothetical protein